MALAEPAADQMVSTFAGSAWKSLPLRADEWVLTGSDGCAFLSAADAPPSAAEMAAAKSSTWHGACHFGLREGRGVVVTRDDVYTEKSYRYGFELGGAGVSWFKLGDSWRRSQYEFYYSPRRLESLYLSDWPSRVDELDRLGMPLHIPMLIHYEDSTHASRYRAMIEFCSARAVDAKLLSTFPLNQRAAAALRCTNAQRFRTVQFQQYEHPADFGKFPDGGEAHYLVTRNYLCASMTDCQAAWNEALEQDWPRLQQLQADLTAANAAYLTDLENRMAPIEAAYQVRLKQFAAKRGNHNRRGARG